MNRLLAVDATGLYVRSERAARTARMDSGVQYLFARQLISFLRADRPTHVIACWDGHAARAYRQALWPLYKHNRPEQLAGRDSRPFGDCRLVLQALRVTEIGADGYEADDEIAWACRKFRERYGPALSVIRSDDADMLQLAGSGVLIRPLHGTGCMDADDVVIKYGCTPNYLPEVKALAGDPSDNIPGIRGIGVKTAVKLLAQADWQLRSVQHPALTGNQDLRDLVDTWRLVTDLHDRWQHLDASLEVTERVRLGMERLRWSPELATPGAEQVFARHGMKSLQESLRLGRLWGLTSPEPQS